ncbi:hypothetical protein WP12_16625 [Sphingomonas sp. SRS2]|nr:hypothetical protein WP12_16625 [Sphingomonas sp. SRS2]
MAYSENDLTTIRSHIASGVMKVRFADGREVTYQSTDALMAAERVIASQLNVATGVRRKRFAAYRSGL